MDYDIRQTLTHIELESILRMENILSKKTSLPLTTFYETPDMLLFHSIRKTAGEKMKGKKMTEKKTSLKKGAMDKSTRPMRHKNQVQLVQRTVVDNFKLIGTKIEVKKSPGLGRGVFATKPIHRGDDITALIGDLYSEEYDTDIRNDYAFETTKGSEKKVYAPTIDEIKQPNPPMEKCAHLANHSFKNVNAELVVVDGNTVRAAFPDDESFIRRYRGHLRATRDIQEGQEILWDYRWTEYPDEWDREK